jgi:hypothetical protein
LERFREAPFVWLPQWLTCQPPSNLFIGVAWRRLCALQAALTALKEEKMVENAQAMGEIMRKNLVRCVARARVCSGRAWRAMGETTCKSLVRSFVRRACVLSGPWQGGRRRWAGAQFPVRREGGMEVRVVQAQSWLVALLVLVSCAAG